MPLKAIATIVFMSIGATSVAFQDDGGEHIDSIDSAATAQETESLANNINADVSENDHRHAHKKTNTLKVRHLYDDEEFNAGAIGHVDAMANLQTGRQFTEAIDQYAKLNDRLNGSEEPTTLDITEQSINTDESGIQVLEGGDISIIHKDATTTPQEIKERELASMLTRKGPRQFGYDVNRSEGTKYSNAHFTVMRGKVGKIGKRGAGVERSKWENGNFGWNNSWNNDWSWDDDDDDDWWSGSSGKSGKSAKGGKTAKGWKSNKGWGKGWEGLGA